MKHGLGIKRGLSADTFPSWCGLSLKIAELTHKSQKMLLFQFSPALLSWVSLFVKFINNYDQSIGSI